MATSDVELRALWDQAHDAYERLRVAQARLGKNTKELQPLVDDFQMKHRRWWVAQTEPAPGP